jgi:hypothetical protein
VRTSVERGELEKNGRMGEEEGIEKIGLIFAIHIHIHCCVLMVSDSQA